MKAGLFFGSFNPVHNGHLAIAGYMAEHTDLDEVWLIVSPQNPLKDDHNLLADHHRLEMLRRAVAAFVQSPANKQLSAKIKLDNADIEFDMPKPSFTYSTLSVLQNKHPEMEFVLIIGSDNLMRFDNWRNHDEILENYRLYVYPRAGDAMGLLKDHPNVKPVNAPLLEISAEDVRKSIRNGDDVSGLVPTAAYDYIKEMGFYG